MTISAQADLATAGGMTRLVAGEMWTFSARLDGLL
jgi:hypothetical protein